MSTQHAFRAPEHTVGDRCRRARLDAGYRKPRNLAAVAPISENTIRKYELDDFGKRGPSASTLNHWANATGVTVEWLRTGTWGDGGSGGTVTPIRTGNRSTVPRRYRVPAAA